MARQRMVIEGFKCSSGFSVQEVYSFLEQLSKAIDMKIVVPPIIVKIPVLHAHDSISAANDFGVSGSVIWLESGAQIHTWPEHRLVTLDIFSCKPYPEDVVEKCFCEWFCPQHISVGHVSWTKREGGGR